MQYVFVEVNNMNLTLSGSLVIDLNDMVNYSVTEYDPKIAVLNGNDTYPNIDEQLRITVRGTSTSGVGANIKKLLQLQTDARNQNRVMTLSRSALDGTVYRTRLTAFDVSVPTSFFNYAALQGLPEVIINITRKGLFLADTIETQYPIASGLSGHVTTFSGLTRQSVYAPTDITMSGFYENYTTTGADVLPRGYLFVAGREQSSIPAIHYIPASGTFYTSTGPIYGVEVTDAKVAPGKVYRYNYGWGDLNNALDNRVYVSNQTSVDVLNAYPRVHVFGTVRNTSGVTWVTSLFGDTTYSSATTRDNELLSGQQIITVSGDIEPKIVYFGTMTRPYTKQYKGWGFTLNPLTNYTTQVAPADVYVPTISGRNIYIGGLWMVGDSLESNIIQTQETTSYTTRYKEVYAKANYISGDPTFQVQFTVGSQGEKFRTWPVVGDTMIQTASDTVDVCYAATISGSWVYYQPLTSKMLHLRFGISRPIATNLVGIG